MSNAAEMDAQEIINYIATALPKDRPSSCTCARSRA